MRKRAFSISEMEQLTETQRDTLEYIRSYIDNNKIPPSVREISAHFGVNVKSSVDRITGLIKKGYIRRIPKASRGLIIIK